MVMPLLAAVQSHELLLGTHCMLAPPSGPPRFLHEYVGGHEMTVQSRPQKLPVGYGRQWSLPSGEPHSVSLEHGVQIKLFSGTHTL